MDPIQRPKRGRPPLPPEERKGEFVPLRMTTQLKEAVESQARIQGVNASDVIRAALIQYLAGKENQQ